MSGSLYLGLISGTSMDGIDAALVRFGERSATLEAGAAYPYSDAIRKRLLAAIHAPHDVGLDELGSLDAAAGAAFRDAALDLLGTAGIPAAEVAAIGSHGQTMRHRVDLDPPFTLQIGDPNVIAAGTGITTVADFRRRDVALGGQGAPLAPAFHDWLFADDRRRGVLNLGGIANLTLPGAGPGQATGFDTGPANTLMDGWMRRHRNTDYDADGEFAASGSVQDKLLERLLRDPYFALPPPKSTGFEYFNQPWLDAQLDGFSYSAADVQATLLALSVRSIADSLAASASGIDTVVACGGGVHNAFLMRELAAAIAPARLTTTAELGIDPDWVEAAAFAWLASRTLAGKAGNLPSVTGASSPAVLGAVYPAGASAKRPG